MNLDGSNSTSVCLDMTEDYVFDARDMLARLR